MIYILGARIGLVSDSQTVVFWVLPGPRFYLDPQRYLKQCPSAIIWQLSYILWGRGSWSQAAAPEAQGSNAEDSDAATHPARFKWLGGRRGMAIFLGGRREGIGQESQEGPSPEGSIDSLRQNPGSEPYTSYGFENQSPTGSIYGSFGSLSKSSKLALL